MNNLKLFRTLAGLKCRQLSSLLLVSAHVYGYYEKDFPLPPETAVMLARIYRIDNAQLLCPVNEITDETIRNIEEISKIDPTDRDRILSLNLTNGKYEKLNFKKLWRIREEILHELQQI